MDLIKHAYTDFCDCFRCVKIRDGHKPEDVNAFFDGELPLIAPPVSNVIYADFKNKKAALSLNV